MRKILTALAAAACVAGATLTTPGTADAQRWGGWRGGGWHGGWHGGGWRGGWGGGAFIGGLAAGALLGGALAAPYYYPAPYAYGPVYYAPPGCFRRAWNGWRWVRVRVC